MDRGVYIHISSKWGMGISTIVGTWMANYGTYSKLPLCVCCVCACVCTCVRVHVCVCICMCLYMCIKEYMCLYVCMYVYMCVRMCMCMGSHIQSVITFIWHHFRPPLTMMVITKQSSTGRARKMHCYIVHGYVIKTTQTIAFSVYLLFIPLWWDF